MCEEFGCFGDEGVVFDGLIDFKVCLWCGVLLCMVREFKEDNFIVWVVVLIYYGIFVIFLVIIVLFEGFVVCCCWCLWSKVLV